jgi:tRNA U34 2-thiouridine synthase MnmA/TrmU
MIKSKAICLLSGGLDSIIAAKLVQSQGIDVEALIFKSPFFNYKEPCSAQKTAQANNIPCKIIDISKLFLKILKKPKHGYGKNLNPCIDCKILMLKLANKYMKKEKASFVVTGEVLDQRPKSQHKKALDIIQKESGLKDRLLRPLSAKLLQTTYPEKNNIVNREKLLDIQGRQRVKQIEFAKQHNIKDYNTPSGGCLLTESEYCQKLKDLLTNEKNPSIKNIILLKIGRHFRIGKTKIVVGRNKDDNLMIHQLKNKNDVLFEPKEVMGPTTVLQGPKNKESLKLAAGLTARYSDSKEDNVLIKYGVNFSKVIKAMKINDIDKYRIK